MQAENSELWLFELGKPICPGGVPGARIIAVAVTDWPKGAAATVAVPAARPAASV